GLPPVPHGTGRPAAPARAGGVGPSWPARPLGRAADRVRAPGRIVRRRARRHPGLRESAPRRRDLPAEVEAAVPRRLEGVRGMGALGKPCGAGDQPPAPDGAPVRTSAPALRVRSTFTALPRRSIRPCVAYMVGDRPAPATVVVRRGPSPLLPRRAGLHSPTL